MALERQEGSSVESAESEESDESLSEESMESEESEESESVAPGAEVTPKGLRLPPLLGFSRRHHVLEPPPARASSFALWRLIYAQRPVPRSSTAVVQLSWR